MEAVLVDTLKQLLMNLADWMDPLIPNISMAFVATILVIYGNDINLVVKKSMSHLHFMIRFAAYIFICAFGYGALTVVSMQVLTNVLNSVPKYTVPFVVGGLFILVGFTAVRKKQV